MWIKNGTTLVNSNHIDDMWIGREGDALATRYYFDGRMCSKALYINNNVDVVAEKLNLIAEAISHYKGFVDISD